MSLTDLSQAWRELRRNRPSADDQLALSDIEVDGQATGIVVAVDAAGELHLLVPVTAGPSRPLPPDVNSLKMRHRVLSSGPQLELISPSAHELMFATLCEQVIAAVHTEHREPWASATAIVRNWQSAWRPLRQPMSKAVQTGLIGELLMLQALWLPALGSAAVHLWSGPDSERHDFVGTQLHMEVKTTRASRHEHEISRVDQLTPADGRRLLFASVQLEESAAGAASLATVIDAISTEIGHDPAAVDGFLTRLIDLNWSPEMRRSPELLRFNLRHAQIFEVDDEFPRLPEGFSLPAGITAIRYSISLANLPWLDPDEVRADIQRQGADLT